LDIFRGEGEEDTSKGRKFQDALLLINPCPRKGIAQSYNRLLLTIAGVFKALKVHPSLLDSGGENSIAEQSCLNMKDILGLPGSSKCTPPSRNNLSASCSITYARIKLHIHKEGLKWIIVTIIQNQ
jgi:hypothetical protein